MNYMECNIQFGTRNIFAPDKKNDALVSVCRNIFIEKYYSSASSHESRENETVQIDRVVPNLYHFIEERNIFL